MFINIIQVYFYSEITAYSNLIHHPKFISVYFVTYLYNSMLSETKKSVSIRRSAKLPKLGIQQQIDNQEVAERMNRKINFAKNPRHLNQTITYASALTNSHSALSKFRVEPEQLFFGQYDTHHVYESEVRLVNISRYIQRIKITPLKQKQFVLFSIKYPNQNSGDIAPGMVVSISIRFRPPSLNDYHDQLVIIAGDGVIKVPILAQRQRCQISWPKNIQCGHCWLGDFIKKEIVLKNKGGEGSYHIVGAPDDKDYYKIGCFKISPTSLTFMKGLDEKIEIQFKPEEKGVFKEKIVFETKEGDMQMMEIMLEGGAYSAQIVLEEMNCHKMLEQKIHHDMFIENSQVGKESTVSLKVRNLAVVQVDYFWHFQKTRMIIDKIEGKMKPRELLEFKIKIKPLQITPQNICLQLFLFDLPEKSLAGNVVAQKINGKQAIQCLSINIKTKPSQSSIEVFPLHRRIEQALYTHCEVKEFITIENKSQVARSFQISKIFEDNGLVAHCSEKEGIVESNSEKQIQINFCLNDLTSQYKKAYFLISFDNSKSQIFSIEGKSTYPELQFSQQKLYFGLLKTFTLNRRRVVIRNPQKIVADVKIINNFRFYQLDFYDFYDFEDESCYMKKFNIYDAVTKEELVNEFQIAAESQISLDCYLNTMGEDSFEFQVYFELKNGETTKIQIIAEIQDVHMSTNRNEINMRQIYKGNVYNSNKFLSKQLQLVNEGNHDCGFEIIQPQFQQCDIKISPLKGIVQKDSTQRVDLIIEPIKTGDFNFNIEWRYFDPFKVSPDLYLVQSESVSFNLQDGEKTMIKDRNLKLYGTIKGMAMNYYIKDDARAKKVKVKVEDGMQSVKLSNSSFQASSYKGSQRFHENEKLVYPPLEEINFYNCEINQVRQVEIIIQNDSGLTTEYEVYAEEYHTAQKPKDQKTSKGLMKIEEEPFTSEMGKTFIRNRTLDRSQKIHLGNNKGISVLCEPASGILNKKQNQKILITMFNDTSGRFKDNLLICVKNHETKKIPIDIQIKGTPVALSKNQLGIDFNRQIPFMHLGTILHSNGLVRKNIKVVNNGPKEVELKWLIYPHNKVDKQKDIFHIQFEETGPGSDNIVEVKWNALKPEVDNNSFFSIQPRVKTIKGREEVNFTIIIQEIKEVGSYSNLLICEPYLINGTQRTEMESLAVQVQTDTISPFLSMDVPYKSNINVMEKYATAHEEYQTNSNFHQRILKLKNNMNSNLTFDIEIINKNKEVSGFKIVQTKTNSPATISSTTKNIQTSFVITPASILQVKVEITGNPSNLNEWPMQQKIRRDGQLMISYSNGQKQIFPLVGWLYRPWIQIQMPNLKYFSSENFEIDFGTVHIKNSKKQSLYLLNPSKVDARFAITYIKYQQSIKYKFEQSLWTNLDYEDQSITDQKKCWRLSQDSGILKNRSIPVHYMPNTLALPGVDDQYAEAHKPIHLQILFKPQANVLYKSKFRVAITEGLNFDLVVKGRGTYQQQLEKK